MNSWGFSPLIEIRSVNPEDPKSLWDFHQVGFQHAWLWYLAFSHGCHLRVNSGGYGNVGAIY